MKLTGQLTGIAPGEEIYAARFMGNTGYFVTYRNTDRCLPWIYQTRKNRKLSANSRWPASPEYRFLGWYTFAGIGYESDEKTGNIENIKLSMFNIRKSGRSNEEAKLVLKDVDYSEALYDYKSVIISKDKNLIGLVCEIVAAAEQSRPTRYIPMKMEPLRNRQKFRTLTESITRMSVECIVAMYFTSGLMITLHPMTWPMDLKR